MIVGCWCYLGYLSMGFRWRSQSPVNASEFACCPMGRWCGVRAYSNSHGFVSHHFFNHISFSILSVLLGCYFPVLKHLQYWRPVYVGGRIVPRFQELTPEKLGKVSHQHYPPNNPKKPDTRTPIFFPYVNWWYNSPLVSFLVAWYTYRSL